MATLGLQTLWIECSQKWARALTRITLPRPTTTQMAIPSPPIEAASLRSSEMEIKATEDGNEISPQSGWQWVERILGEQITNSILLMAVPKKRTTHSKKRKRMTHKYLSRRTSMVECEFCGGWKRPHFYCTPDCPGRRRNSL